MCNSSSSVLVLNRTSPSLLHTFVAYTTQLSIAIQHTRNSFYTHTSRVNAFGRLLVFYTFVCKKVPGKLQTKTWKIESKPLEKFQAQVRPHIFLGQSFAF